MLRPFYLCFCSISMFNNNALDLREQCPHCLTYRWSDIQTVGNKAAAADDDDDDNDLAPTYKTVRFLYASSHLYKTVCLSVGPSVGNAFMQDKLHEPNSILVFQCIRTHHWPLGLVDDTVHFPSRDVGIKELRPRSKIYQHHRTFLSFILQFNYKIIDCNMHEKVCIRNISHFYRWLKSSK